MVQYRMKQMKEKKVILSHSIQLNVNAFGYDYYKTIINLQNMSKETENALIEYCKQLGYVLYYIKTLGPWELELEWEVQDYKHLNLLMDGIRAHFGKHIKAYNHLLIVEEYKGEYNALG